jgi:AI-2 transport protein TqsA
LASRDLRPAPAPPPAAARQRLQWPGSADGVIIGLLAVIAVILTAAALRASAPVTLPLAFAYFLAVLVCPMQAWLAQRLPHRLQGLSVLLTMLAVVGVLALALALLAFALQLMVNGAPQHLDQLEQQFQAWRDWARSHNLPLPDLGNGEGLRALGERLLSGLTSIGTISAFALLIFFFTLLMLLEASAWRRKTATALKASGTHAVLDAVASIGHKVRQYLLVRTLAGLISGVLAGLWLWLLGVDFALLWGLLFFLLNYVPNIGSLIAGIPPTILAFMQLGLGWATVAAAGLLAIDQVIGNYLDPRLQGRTLNISSLVVLASVILWGWIWGVVGTLLAVPMTVLIISVCERVPALQPVAILMRGGSGERPTEHA